MKILILLSALLIALASCASSPVTEQSSTAAQTAALTETAGSKQERTVTVKVPVEKRALTRFADGTLDEYTVSEYDSSDTLLLSQSRYSASGALAEKTEYAYEGGLLRSKTVRDQEEKIRSQTQYEYDGSGRLIREELLNAVGRTVSSFVYAYDGTGSRVSRKVNGPSGAPMAAISYVYKNGLLVSSETVDGSGAKTGSSENSYDGQGNLVAQRMFNSRGSLMRIIQSVWENGREVKIEQTTAGGQLQRRLLNEYGADGELLRTTIEDNLGKPTQIIEREYVFREEQRTIYQ